MAELRLVDRATLLLFHDVVPCADVRLSLDEDGYPRLYIVVVQHIAAFYRRGRASAIRVTRHAYCRAEEPESLRLIQKCAFVQFY